MSRSISQIYAEAVATRNDYLQISSLDSGRSESKMSVMNILTYVIAVLIYSYEVILDSFQVKIAQLISERVNGTPTYYAKMAKYFQYNPLTESMDEMYYDEDTFQAKFVTKDETHRIIAKSAFQNYSDTDASAGIVIKVCKDNDDSTSADGGGVYTALDTKELTAFKNYMDEIKFIGAKIFCRSILGDILSVNATVIYDDLYIDAEQALENVKTALIEYIKGLDFNGYIYYQSVIDAIQGAEHIVSVAGPSSEQAYAIVTKKSYNEDNKAYDEAQIITNRDIPFSGYCTFVDETATDRTSTLVADSDHFIFKANSTLTATTSE